ncbi:MAG: hypothetical protein CSA58_09015 [Micrococcales bacterium]|nr:MAG: hypothetical protein CSA58_09015 [Micrococcales bacterium]
MHFVGGSYGRAFQVAPVGAHEFGAKYLFEAELSGRMKVGQHEVRISRTADGRTTLASLIGQHHELMTVFAGPAPESRKVAELFAVLDVRDHRDGMRVSPQRWTGLTVGSENLVLSTVDNTSIAAPAPAFARQVIPSKSGRRTRQGEVWRTQLPGRGKDSAHDYAYLVGTPNGVAEVVFADSEAITEDEAMHMLDTLDLSWK